MADFQRVKNRRATRLSRHSRRAINLVAHAGVPSPIFDAENLTYVRDKAPWQRPHHCQARRPDLQAARAKLESLTYRSPAERLDARVEIEDGGFDRSGASGSVVGSNLHQQERTAICPPWASVGHFAIRGVGL